MSDGIGVNVERTVGEEVAKKLVSIISEEELEAEAKSCWNSMRAKKQDWGCSSSMSQIEKVFNSTFSSVFTEKIREMLSTNEYKSKLDQMAKEAVEEIAIKTKGMLVQNVSERLAGNVVDPAMNIRYQVEHIVQEMLMR